MNKVIRNACIFAALFACSLAQALNRPNMIGLRDVTVDGYLTEWSDAEWAPLDQVYNGNPAADIAEAYYSAGWSQITNKLYVAVKVRDTSHYFTNTYTAWDARDAIEVYFHTTSSGSIAFNCQAGYGTGLRRRNKS